MQRNGVVVLVSVALLSVAGIVAAYFFTHKPEPEPEPVDLYEHSRAAEIACLEGGGSWVPGALGGTMTCEHSEPTTAAPPVEAPSTSDGGGSGGKTIQEVAYGTPEQAVNRMFTPAEQAQFCSLAIQAGFDAALRAWMSAWDTPGTTRSYAKEVFMEATSRCV
jgi:hypothetical protein